MRYIARRFLLLLLTAWVALTINFALPRLMPGNPIEALAVQFKGNITPTALHAITLELGLNNHKPILTQYFDYLGNTLTGNLGFSLSQYPERVSTLIGQSIWWTIGLVGTATVIGLFLGSLVGAIAAWRRGKMFDSFMVPLGVLLASAPVFWFGQFVLYWVGYKWGVFPVNGTVSGKLLSWNGFVQILDHAAMPAFCLVVVVAGGAVILMRNTTVATLSDDFIKFAKAKGLRGRTVALSYAVRNALLPVFTNMALTISFVVAGQLFIEWVFNYQGVAYLLLQAVLNYDLPLMQGLFLIIVLIVLVVNFLADIIYVFLDPRIRTVGRAS